MSIWNRRVIIKVGWDIDCLRGTWLFCDHSKEGNYVPVGAAS